MSDQIGDIIEKKMSIEWRVPGFFSLPSEVDDESWSPVVFFADAAWQLSVFPNGWLGEQADGNVSLFLNRISRGPPDIMSFSLGLRNANGGEENVKYLSNHIFDEVNEGWGIVKFIERSNLLSRKDQLAPKDTLTVVCSLNPGDGHTLDGSLSTRLWNLSLNLATVVSTPEDADVTLKLSDGELDAHKMILKARSSVFGRMFSHDDLKEGQTGEVKIEEGDKESFQVVLDYIYTGDPRGLSAKNVKDVYKISHKYDLCDLTRCCSKFLRACLSVETICDVARIAFLYQDQKLIDCAKDYFFRHRNEIIKTDQWKALREENHEMVYDIIEYALINI